ncbi:MAG: hypothetical protein J6Q53_04160 [Oscillospiraceae bacterium]|nr:hypothetical protein [Oscillospiraceae bacterium]
MTRKRFVKQLMSIGYSRNEANKEARTAVSDGVSYDGKYLYILCEKNGLMPVEWFDGVGNCVAQLARIIEGWIQHIVEVIPTIIEAITAAMPQVIAEVERRRQEEESATE